ncbi:MAG: FapA family protein [Pelosinus sp.]|nr:FapA family protein [Pelosinus sp.]
MAEEQQGQQNHKSDKEGNGYFKLAATNDGIFLTVYPPQNGGVPVNETVVIADIKKQGIEKLNEVLLIDTIRAAAGQSVKIGEAAGAQPEIHVMVSRDRMEATLEIDVPIAKCQPVTGEQVMEKIASSGVSFNINNEAIQSAIKTPGLMVVFATGQKPVDGVPASIKYYVDTSQKGRPTEMADGRVDYKDLNLFTVVTQGQLIAEKIPATPGTVGTDVLGQVLPAKPGKDLNLPLGKGVSSADKLHVLADIDGQLTVINGKINVIQIIEIKGDVGVSTGNVEFVGSVIVRGSVQQDFSVIAKGDVEVYGTVSGGIVEGKSVVIKMGIQGMHRGHIKAAENVVAKFMENATVYAGNDVIVSDVILHSRVNAAKKVIVEGKRGLITGGTISAGEEIRAQSVGTPMATATGLEVGVNPVLREEYQKLRVDLKKVEQSLEQTQKALTILKAINPSDLSPDKREMLLKLTKAQFNLVGQAENMRKRTVELENALEEMKYGRIKVAKELYPGVKAVIGTLIKPIREPLKFVSLYAEDGEIKVGTFK